MEESIFTKIVKGEIPAHKIYEDDTVIAFLDIHPRLPGHSLVIPKQQVQWIWDLPDDLYAHLMEVCKKIATHMRQAMPTPHVHLGIVGTDVPHSHVHLIPFNKSSDLANEPDMTVEPDHAELADMAVKLKTT